MKHEKKIRLSVITVTYNNELTIKKMLFSLNRCYSELLVSDQNSTDSTVEILNSCGAKIYNTRNTNLGIRLNELLKLVKSQWVLLIVSDEVLSSHLRREILKVISIKQNRIVAYKIKFENYIFDRPVYFGGESYERIRLFQKKYTRISTDPIHETILVKGPIGKLEGTIYHFSYSSLKQLFIKFTRYAFITADMKYKNRENITFKKLVMYGPHMFWARFIKEKGYRDGWRGLVLAFAFGYMEGLTYWLLLTKMI